MKPVSVAQLVSATGGTLLRRDGEQLFTSAGSDSRCVKEGMLFVPQYIAHGRRTELYWFQLEIDDTRSREAVLLSRTGRKDLCEVPSEVRALFDLCYLTVLPPRRTVPVTSMLRYFNELLRRKDVIEGIERLFGAFDPANMYVSVF